MATKRTGYVDPSGERSMRARGGTLVPGAVIGDGRYRLLAQFGADTRADAQLWRARDGQLGRDVALTVLVGEPADATAAAASRRTLERAMHAAQFTDDGVARVLDVISLGSGIVPSEGILGMVVADWTPGTDLVDLISDGPVPPGTAAALLEPLASSVEQAHHSGLVLGVDHPQRIRITGQGALRLAFPGPLPQATLRDDVRGLGAVLYLLLTGRWPLDGGPEALTPAPRGPDGTVVAPRTLRPETPHDLSNLAVRCLSDTAVGGIRTSAAIMAVLDNVATSEPQTTIMDRLPTDPDDAVDTDAEDNTVWTTKKPVNDPRQRRRLAVSVTLLVLATVAVAVWLVYGVFSFFSDSGSDAARGPAIGDATDKPGKAKPQLPERPEGRKIPPAAIDVFNLESEPDHPEQAGLAIDGERATSWSTDVYQSNFPTLKEGVGLIATFAEPVKLSEVDLISPSAGSLVEVRTADTPTPTSIEETQLVGGGPNGKITNGLSRIQLRDAPPTRYVILWITKLGGDDNVGISTSIDEIGYHGDPAGP